jgi:hypothetical protein
MIVTLKTITKEGFFKVQIKPAVGEKYHREFTAAALYEYLQAADFYCESKGYSLHFIVPDAMKKMCGAWLESFTK